MTRLQTLIVQLEAAKQGSRELDELIVLALYPSAQVVIYVQGDEEKTVFHTEPLVTNKHELPYFTTSLDAAVQLVPKGGYWEVRCNPMAFVRLTGSSDPLFTCIKAATPALALCIAALTATKQQWMSDAMRLLHFAR